MTYSVGSGTYVDMMAAVLSHAVTDGWTTTAGNWPISKGRVRGVDWDSYTVNDNNYNSGSPIAHTTRWIRIAIGSSHANATANLGSNAAHCPNMEYTIDQWFIFSDPSSGADFIHCVFRFSNDVDAKCYGHFSFGEVNRHGMSHGGVAYASAHPCRAFAAGYSDNPIYPLDCNAGLHARVRRTFTGRLGYNGSIYNTENNICYMSDAANSPFPSLSVWPDDDVLHNDARVLDTMALHHYDYNVETSYLNNTNAKFSTAPFDFTAQPYSGGISLGPLPLFIANTTSNSSSLKMIQVGSFPNVRTCSLISFLPEDEITYGGDTWKVFPLIVKKPKNTLGNSTVVSSGEYGLAYKKVA